MSDEPNEVVPGLADDVVLKPVHDPPIGERETAAERQADFAPSEIRDATEAELREAGA